jgi:hypothetical protein
MMKDEIHKKIQNVFNRKKKKDKKKLFDIVTKTDPASQS